MAGTDSNYSTLEVVQQSSAKNTSSPSRSPFVAAADGEGLEVARDDSGKVFVPPPQSNYYGEQNHTGASGSQEGFVRHNFDHAQDKPLQTDRPWWKKKRFFVTGIVLLIVIAAAIGAALGTTLSDGDDGDSPPAGSGEPNASLPDSLMEKRIAAVSVEDGSVNRTWVFYQNNDGKIVRSGATSPGGPWTTTEIGANGKEGTTLAAAVSRPGFPLQIHVFYVGDNGEIHDMIYSDSTGRWDHGNISDESFTIMPNSSFTAMYNQCRRCFNTTLLAFQDNNGFVQIANLTSSGWSTSQLGNTLDPAIGTGLALQPFYRANTSDQINLYYQKAGDLNLTLAAYQESLSANNDPGWRLNAQAHGPFPFGAPLATAASYSNITNGLESWIQVLSLGDAGVRVSSWAGTQNGWTHRFARPSPMANSTVNEKVYGHLAMTATGSAFAVTQAGEDVPKIEMWQLQDDFHSWEGVGEIDAW